MPPSTLIEVYNAIGMQQSELLNEHVDTQSKETLVLIKGFEWVLEVLRPLVKDMPQVSIVKDEDGVNVDFQLSDMVLAVEDWMTPAILRAFADALEKHNET